MMDQSCIKMVTRDAFAFGPAFQVLETSIKSSQTLLRKFTRSLQSDHLICICVLLSLSLIFSQVNQKPEKILDMSWVGPGDWMCAACEHMNFKKRDSCQKCGYSKFGGQLPTDISSSDGYNNRTEVLAGDWYCCAMNCGAHNYASRPNCYRCGAAKDVDPYCGGYGNNLMAASCGGFGYDTNGAIPGWKTGDWICARYGCGMHNYASRLECYKCKTPREYGGGI